MKVTARAIVSSRDVYVVGWCYYNNKNNAIVCYNTGSISLAMKGSEDDFKLSYWLLRLVLETIQS